METFDQGHAKDGNRRVILVVEDDQDLCELLDSRLRMAGFGVHTANDGPQALEALTKSPFNLVLLDLMLPGMSGWEICSEIRAQCDIPILIMSAKSQMPDILSGFQLGADDYLTKPFDMRELVARVRVATQRPAGSSGWTLRRGFRFGALAVDFRERLATIRGKKVTLTPTEVRLLACLTAVPGALVPHEEILRRVWGWDYTNEKGYVKLYISYLRRKLERHPGRPELLMTERALGYRLNVAPLSSLGGSDGLERAATHATAF